MAKISGRSLQRHNLSAGRRSTLWQFNNWLCFLFSLSCISKEDLDSSSQILETEGNNCDFKISSIPWLLTQQFCNRFIFGQGFFYHFLIFTKSMITVTVRGESHENTSPYRLPVFNGPPSVIIGRRTMLSKPRRFTTILIWPPASLLQLTKAPGL